MSGRTNTLQVNTEMVIDFVGLQQRGRAMSQASILRRVMNSTSRGKQFGKSASVATYRPKLDRLLQEGKIQTIMNCDPHSKASLYYTNHINDLQKQLAASKKALSAMAMKAKSKQFSINRLKDQINRSQRQTKTISTDFTASNQKYNSAETVLKHKQQMFERDYWQQKCLEAKRNNLQKDVELLRTRYQLGAKILTSRHQAKKLLQNRYYQAVQKNKELKSMAKQAGAISQAQSHQKTEFVQILNKQLDERKQLDVLLQQKLQKQREINSISTGLIEKQQLAKYMEIINTHRFLQKIIKMKTAKLLKIYQGVQQSFTHMKINTNYTSIEQILTRMQSQDQIYEQRLRQVSKLESRLNQLELQAQKIAKQRQKILSMEGNHVKLPKNYYQGRERDQYVLHLSRLEKINTKKLSDEILKTNIQQWARKYFHIYGIKQQGQTFTTCLTQLIQTLEPKKKQELKL